MGSVWFLVLILRVSASPRKHNKGAWTEQPIGLSIFFLTLFRLSVKSYQLGLQRKQIQVWSNWRSKKTRMAFEKTLMLGRIEGRRRRGRQRMRWLDGITNSLDWVWASSRSWWATGKPGVLQSMGSQRVGRDWATEQQQRRVTNSVSIYAVDTDSQQGINRSFFS